jgi:HEAT repeat protein
VPLILALADCHNRESFGVVRSQLGAEEPQIRMAALKVVSTVGRGPELATTLLDVVEARPSPEERQVALGLLTRMEGEPGVNRAIREGLRHAEAEDMRIDVMRVLGDRQAEEAVGDLLAQAGDESPRIRAAAFRSMRRLVGPAEVTSLIPLTEKEENASARTAAISTLVSACGDDEGSGDRVLEELEEATDATEADTWIRVLTAVGHPRALPVILEGLEDEDEEVVAATITHLSRWPDPAPVETLLPFLGAGADPRVRPRAVSAVIRLTTQAADGRQRPDDVLVTWFAAANGAIQAVPEKRQLLSGLGRVHTLGSLRLLEPYLRDPEVEVEALYALLAMGSPLVKAGEREAVREVLPAESAIEDQELRWRIARLRRQVEEAESPE